LERSGVALRLRLLRGLLGELLGARLEVFLLLELAVEHLLHRLLLLRLLHREGVAQLHQVDRPVDRARRKDDPALLHAHGLQAIVVYLQRERWLVHLVEEVPDVERAVHLRREEDGRPRGRPARREEIGRVIRGGHDGRAQLFGPEHVPPVADREEVLWEEGVALQRVRRSMVP